MSKKLTRLTKADYDCIKRDLITGDYIGVITVEKKQFDGQLFGFDNGTILLTNGLAFYYYDLYALFHLEPIEVTSK